MKVVQEKLGDVVRLVRSRRRLTQKEAAEKAGISVSYWALIEQGKRRPGIDILERIADSLDVPTTVLVFLSSDLGELEEFDRELAERLALLSWKLIAAAEGSEESTSDD